MERLIENALIYGAMYHVSEPYMVERYNQALKGFGLEAVKLDSFAVDATGYSPEVAKVLDDEDYLNPYGVNRRFIILSPEQKGLPIVSLKFSSTHDLMQAFFTQNDEALRLLTLKDVVFGEIEDSTYRVRNIADILTIRQVEFRLRTGSGLMDKARELQELVNRFYAGADSWQDTKLMEDILARAQLTGDVRFNNIIPQKLRFEITSYWTSHFGGLFVFRDSDENGKAMIIGKETRPDFISGLSDGTSYLPLGDSEGVYDFLLNSGRIEGPEADWLAGSGMVERRRNFLVRTLIGQTEKNTDLEALDDNAVRNWIYAHLDELGDDGVFEFLTTVSKGLLNGRLPDLRRTDTRLLMTIIRANPAHEDAVLVNRLLSEYAPFDYFTRFAVNKQGFYSDYEKMSDNLRSFVAGRLAQDYFPVRQAFWDELFASRKG